MKKRSTTKPKKTSRQSAPVVRGLEIHERWWSVVIDGQNGRGFARNGHGGRFVAGTERDANRFCDELQKHITSRCSVVEVELLMREIITGEQ